MPTLRELTRMSYLDSLRVLAGEKAAKAIASRYRPAMLPSVGNALSDVQGVGKVTVRRIEAAIALGYWISTDENPLPVVHKPEDAYEILRPRMERLEQEELWVVVMNTRNRVLDARMVYRGSVNSAQVRVGELFKDAIRINAAAIIIAHNHPSGDTTPSPDDVAVTRAIVEAGKLLDVAVLDHLVIGQGRFVSLKERGLGFS